MACFCACSRCLAGDCCMAPGRYAPGHFPNWTVVWPPYKIETTTTDTVGKTVIFGCPKCHATDARVRWHRGVYGASTPACSREENPDWSEASEHLHYTCQTCLYHWARKVAE